MNNKNTKIFCFFISLLFFSGCAEREMFDNIVSPGITGLFKEIQGSVSGTLSFEESPYYAAEDLIIDSGKTLTVEPGVEVYFDENSRLIVKGELKILGSFRWRVFLLAYNTNWKGLKIYYADKPAEIKFAIIQDIKDNDNSIYGPSGISVNNSSLTLTNSVIINNSSLHGGGIGSANSVVKIYNNIFRDNFADNFGGAIVSDASDIAIVNNTLYKNSAFNGGGGIAIFDPVETEIQNNILYKNSASHGRINFHYVSLDSTTLIEQYNFFAVGNMDPLFLNDDDLRLYFQSPAKDAGNPAPEFNDLDGTRNDQGAFGGPLGDW